MKKLNLWLLGSLFVGAFALSACSSSSDSDSGSDEPYVKKDIVNTERQVTLNGKMQEAELKGFVRDKQGNALQGVTVGSGNVYTTTDVMGAFCLKNVEVVKGRTVVDLKKDGYFDVVRSMTEADVDSWEIVMVSKNDNVAASTDSYMSSIEKDLNAGGMKIDMPADGYMVDANGNAYNGTVNTEMIYLDPDADEFAEMMPGGDLAAVRTDVNGAENGQEVQLISYGMTAVSMTDDAGKKLQLKEGKKAKLTFPIPESLLDDTPNEIPLWSFNEATGLWEEEGMATLQGNVYVGEVEHFSWVNLDYPYVRATVYGVVKDGKGNPMPFQKVRYGQVYTYTDKEGRFSVFIPKNTEVSFWVASEDYGGYTPEVIKNVAKQDAGATVNIEIKLPALRQVSGTIDNQAGTNIASVWITYGNNKETKPVFSASDGKYAFMLPTDAQGEAVLKVRTLTGDVVSQKVTLTNGDLEVPTITIKAVTAKSGQVVIYHDNGKEYTLALPMANAGATIVDDYLDISGMDEPTEAEMEKDNWRHVGWSVSIEKGFVSGKAVEGSFSYHDEGYNGHMMISSLYNYGQGEISPTMVTATRNGNNITFDVEGRVTYRADGPDSEYEEIDYQKGNATLIAKSIQVPVATVGHVEKDVTSSDKLPSFTPYLSKAAPVALIYDQSTDFTKGGKLCYDGTKEDYNALVAKADQLTGFVKQDSYDQETNASVTYINATTRSTIYLQYSSYQKQSFNQYLQDPSSQNIMYVYGPVTVTVYEGLASDQSGHLRYAPKRLNK